MNTKLIGQALLRFFIGLVIMAVIVFLPAGGFFFINGWVLTGLLFVPATLISIVLFTDDPDSLWNLIGTGNKKPIDKKGLIICCSVLVVVAVLSGLSYRLKVLQIGTGGSVVGAILFLAGYGLLLEALRERNWIIREGCEVEDLNILDTGVHGFIRHPMYAAVILIFLGVPLLLGSLMGFFAALACPVLVVIRIITWEKVLEEGLPGFKEYEDIIKFRLIPFVW